MTTVTPQVGFSQRVRLEWFDYTAGLVLTGRPRREIETALQAYLQDRISVGGSAQRGNREKAITILLKVWVSPPAHLATFHAAGLDLMRRLSADQHVMLHWGLVMAVYPFWASVAETVGRLLRLQNDVSALQVQRRIKEVMGERETVARAARRILRSFIDWGVLRETSAKGVYAAAPALRVDDDALAAWISEAVVRSTAETWIAAETLGAMPVLFPVRLPVDLRPAIACNPRLEMTRHGIGESIVRLREPPR